MKKILERKVMDTSEKRAELLPNNRYFLHLEGMECYTASHVIIITSFESFIKENLLMKKYECPKFW